MQVYFATRTTYWVLEAASIEAAKHEFDKRLADPEDDFFLAGELIPGLTEPEVLDDEVTIAREATPAEVAHFWQPALHPL